MYDYSKSVLFGLIQIVYSVTSIIYIVNLKKLNAILLKNFPDGHFLTILSYNNSESVKFFFMAFILIVIAAFLLFYYFKCIKESDSFIDMVVLIVCLVITIILVVLIIKHINIPIFKAILGAIMAGTVAIIIFSN